jgi:hypothetical protein
MALPILQTEGIALDFAAKCRRALYTQALVTPQDALLWNEPTPSTAISADQYAEMMTNALLGLTPPLPASFTSTPGGGDAHESYEEIHRGLRHLVAKRVEQLLDARTLKHRSPVNRNRLRGRAPSPHGIVIIDSTQSLPLTVQGSIGNQLDRDPLYAEAPRLLLRSLSTPLHPKLLNQATELFWSVGSEKLPALPFCESTPILYLAGGTPASFAHLIQRTNLISDFLSYKPEFTFVIDTRTAILPFDVHSNDLLWDFELARPNLIPSIVFEDLHTALTRMGPENQDFFLNNLADHIAGTALGQRIERQGRIVGLPAQLRYFAQRSYLRPGDKWPNTFNIIFVKE